jgi:nitrogen regulatory protein PII-like uncharacterized protein
MYFMSQTMKIKTVQAHFQIATGDCNNETIGFCVELEDGESVESVVSDLRKRAIKIIGPKAEDFYEKIREYSSEYRRHKTKLDIIRKEWEATAAFLKAQGLNPDTAAMPPFRNLLEALTIVVEEVTEDDQDNSDNDF